jgi:hypothetical protein
MKHKLLFILILFLLGCHKESPVQPEQKNAKLSESFEIKAGETINIQNELLSFRFDSILNDSRCPEGAYCFWAGNAALSLTFIDKTDTVNTFLDPRVVTEGKYSISLLSLSPYPKVGQSISKHSYVAQFVVNKNEK